ncbi:MAG: dockerin type I domain-containing protein [Chloroflexota bacterium]
MNTCKLLRILTLTLVVAALEGLIWSQAPASPALAQGPGDEPTLAILIVPDGDGFTIAGVTPAPVFTVGDTFKVSIVALGVADPGIFGGQFEVAYNTEHLAAIEGSLLPGTAMEPVVVAVSNINAAEGLVQYAASRQGDLDNLSGNVVLATLRFEAVGPTEPPEGQTTVIHLQNVKLGAKGGIEVPVAGLVDLEVIIRADDVAEEGDITGNVTVEARAADNQAGHEVSAAGDLGGLLADTTDANGDFLINNAPADTYTVTADSPGFLAATCTGVVHTTTALTTLADVTLLAGDIDGNGSIDITDAVAIGAVFGSADPQAADLNLDGVVDILDLILMAANFGQTSVANPWVCQ